MIVTSLKCSFNQLDKHKIKHTGSQRNVQENIGQTDEQTRTY